MSTQSIRAGRDAVHLVLAGPLPGELERGDPAAAADRRELIIDHQYSHVPRARPPWTARTAYGLRPCDSK